MSSADDILAGAIQSRLTLAEYVRDEWWPRYAVPNLKPSTRRRYHEVWGTHLPPRIGDYQLREITPALVEDLCSQFRAAKVGVQTQRSFVRGHLHKSAQLNAIQCCTVVAHCLPQPRVLIQCSSPMVFSLEDTRRERPEGAWWMHGHHHGEIHISPSSR